jgi:hypothetical protein
VGALLAARCHVATRRASRYIGQNADPNRPRALDASLHYMIRGVRIACAPVSQ